MNKAQLEKLKKMGKFPSKKRYKVVNPTYSLSQKKKENKPKVTYNKQNEKRKDQPKPTKQNESWRNPRENIDPNSIPDGYVYFEPTGSYVAVQDLKEAVIQYMSMRKYHTDFSRLPKGKKEAILKLYPKSIYKKALEKDIQDKIVTGQEWIARQGIKGSSIALYAPYSEAPKEDILKSQARNTIKENQLEKNSTISRSQGRVKGGNRQKDISTIQPYIEPTILQPLENLGKTIYQKTRNTNFFVEAAGEVAYGTLGYASYAERQLKAMGRRFSEVLNNKNGFGIPQFNYVIGKEGGKFLTQSSLMIVGGAAGPGVLSLSLAGFEAVENPESVRQDPLKFATKYALVYGIGKAGEMTGEKIVETKQRLQMKIGEKVRENLKTTYSVGKLEIGYGEIKAEGKATTIGNIQNFRVELERTYEIEYSQPLQIGETIQTTGKIKIGKGNVVLDIFGKKIKLGETKATKAYLDITKEKDWITTLATDTTGKRVGSISKAVVKNKGIDIFEDFALYGKEFHFSNKGSEGYIGAFGLGEQKEMSTSLIRYREYQKLRAKNINLQEKTGIEKLWDKKITEVLREGKPRVQETFQSSISELKITKYDYPKKSGENVIQKLKVKDITNIKEIGKVLTGEQVIGKIKEPIDFFSTKEKGIALALPKSQKQEEQRKKSRRSNREAVLYKQIPKQKEKSIKSISLPAIYKTISIPAPLLYKPISKRTRTTSHISPNPAAIIPPANLIQPKQKKDIPFPIFEVIPPMLFDFKGLKGEKRGKLNPKAKYKPSLDAVLFDIHGKKPKRLSGLETRPISTSKSIKKVRLKL